MGKQRAIWPRFQRFIHNPLDTIGSSRAQLEDQLPRYHSGASSVSPSGSANYVLPYVRSNPRRISASGLTQPVHERLPVPCAPPRSSHDFSNFVAQLDLDREILRRKRQQLAENILNDGRNDVLPSPWDSAVVPGLPPTEQSVREAMRARAWQPTASAVSVLENMQCGWSAVAVQQQRRASDHYRGPAQIATHEIPWAGTNYRGGGPERRIAVNAETLSMREVRRTEAEKVPAQSWHERAQFGSRRSIANIVTADRRNVWSAKGHSRQLVSRKDDSRQLVGPWSRTNSAEEHESDNSDLGDLIRAASPGTPLMRADIS